MHEHYLVSLAATLVAGMAARWISWRLHLPSIPLLLICGIIAGPVTGWLDPDALFGNLLLPRDGSITRRSRISEQFDWSSWK